MEDLPLPRPLVVLLMAGFFLDDDPGPLLPLLPLLFWVVLPEAEALLALAAATAALLLPLPGCCAGATELDDDAAVAAAGELLW